LLLPLVVLLLLCCMCCCCKRTIIFDKLFFSSEICCLLVLNLKQKQCCYSGALPNQPISLVVYNWLSSTQRSIIGQLTFTANLMEEQKNKNRWWPLTSPSTAKPEEKANGGFGELRLSFEYRVRISLLSLLSLSFSLLSSLSLSLSLLSLSLSLFSLSLSLSIYLYLYLSLCRITTTLASNIKTVGIAT